MEFYFIQDSETNEVFSISGIDNLIFSPFFFLGRTFFKKSLPGPLWRRTFFPEVCKVRYKDAKPKSDCSTKRTLLYIFSKKNETIYNVYTTHKVFRTIFSRSLSENTRTLVSTLYSTIFNWMLQNSKSHLVF